MTVTDAGDDNNIWTFVHIPRGNLQSDQKQNCKDFLVDNNIFNPYCFIIHLNDSPVWK